MSNDLVCPGCFKLKMWLVKSVIYMLIWMILDWIVNYDGYRQVTWLLPIDLKIIWSDLHFNCNIVIEKKSWSYFLSENNKILNYSFDYSVTFVLAPPTGQTLDLYLHTFCILVCNKVYNIQGPQVGLSASLTLQVSLFPQRSI